MSRAGWYNNQLININQSDGVAMRVVRIRHCALFDGVVIFAATGNNDFVILSVLNLVLNLFFLVKETA